MKQLYQHFHSYALSVCLAHAANRDDALEIMNDGFLKVFRNLGTQRNPDALAGWLRTIMVNTAIDHHRKNGHLKLNTPLEQARHQSAREYGDEAVYAGLSADEILKNVQGLPATQRLVFGLYVIEGYSHKEIAATLGIAESTSRAYLSDANARLRESLTSQARNADAR